MNYNIDKVMKFFREISAIPRMSGKEEKIADYIQTFALKRKLKYVRDKYNNIIIIKERSKWNRSSDSIMLQCHLDMVCEKEENSKHNFEKDGLDLYIDGDFIKARGTTLGADNGIGIAIILAILDSNEINHPRIEAIFTVEEETSMNGAKKINMDIIKANKMICLDNMNEEELWIGCAGAKIFKYIIEGETQNNDKEYALVKIGVNGFVGGHSGKDISEQRGNPIKEMGNLLQILYNKYEILIKNIYGGRKVNVIPRECYADVYIKYEYLNEIKKEIINFNKCLKQRIKNNNENIKITIIEIKDDNNYSFSSIDTKKIIDIIQFIPNGVYYSDKYNNPLVSLNIGKIEKKDNFIFLSFSIRSNRNEIESQLINKLEEITNKYNIQETIQELAGYEHKRRSRFIDKCKIIYKEQFQRNPRVIDMHICLEAGFFGMKIPNLDFIAIAPNIYDAHSPKERCSIKSLEKTYNYILKILKL